jgi:2-dehydro-3-deoxygluconokinase
MKKIFCFGEILLRMSPPAGGQWLRERSMPVHLGGAELNVARALALWGHPVRYMSALPDNHMSEEILAFLSEQQVDVSVMHRSGERTGIYYLPTGSELKHAGVIYDRAGSSFSALTTGMIDWKETLKDCGWFHFSAISPALNARVAELCHEALEAASSMGMHISVDLNYRSKLWKYGKRPVEVMPALTQYCHLVMGNIWSAAELLGTRLYPQLPDRPDTATCLAHARDTSLEIMQTFPRCEKVANTFRFDTNEGLSYYATLDAQGGQSVSDTYHADKVVDKVGSGDCFMGGLIHGTMLGHPDLHTVKFAAAAAFGKLQESGDATAQTISDIEKRIQGT